MLPQQKTVVLLLASALAETGATASSGMRMLKLNVSRPLDCLRLLAAGLPVLALLPAAAAGAAALPVAPGTIVRWPGQGIERCTLGDRSWPPLAGACWYPVDLLTPEGPLVATRWRDGLREEAILRVQPYPYEVQHIALEDDSQVDLSAADLSRVREENRRIAELWALRTPRRFELPLAPPLENLPAAGRFGARRFFNRQPRSPHSGADFRAATGTAVRAAADGTAALVGDFFFSGRSVFLDHGDGLVSMYFHLSAVEVTQGAPVRRAQLIGLVGQSGRATGPHLHFGVRWHGARVDPGLLLGPAERVPALP